MLASEKGEERTRERTNLGSTSAPVPNAASNSSGVVYNSPLYTTKASDCAACKNLFSFCSKNDSDLPAMLPEEKMH